MKSSLGKVSYISAATLAKALVGLIISLIVLTGLEHDASAEVFQLLLLQSTIITMVSGSAYARGVSIEGDLRHGAGLVLALVVMIAAVSALAIAAAILLADTPIWPQSATASYIALLAVGAAATALHTVLQGILMPVAGVKRAFVPSIIAFTISAIVVYFANAKTVAELLLIVVAVQCLPLLIFALLNFDSLRLFNWRNALDDWAFITKYVRETASFGTTATVYLLVILATREVWRDQVEASIAAYVFFAMRLSDLYMQIAFYTFSSIRSTSGVPPLLTHSFTSKLMKYHLAIVAALAVAAAVAVTIVILKIPAELFIVAAILAQVATDAVRLPVTNYLVLAIKRASPKLYAWIVLPPLLIFAASFLAVSSLLPPATLFYCQIAFALAVAAFWTIRANLLPPLSRQATPDST